MCTWVAHGKHDPTQDLKAIRPLSELVMLQNLLQAAEHNKQEVDTATQHCTRALCSSAVMNTFPQPSQEALTLL